MLPYGLQSRVGDLLEAHLSKKSINKENLVYNASLRGSSDNNSPNDKEVYENEKPFARSIVAERILRRRSLEMHNKQEDWQVIFFLLPDCCCQHLFHFLDFCRFTVYNSYLYVVQTLFLLYQLDRVRLLSSFLSSKMFWILQP